MKSIITIPDISLNLNCLAISFAASKLTFVTVFSESFSPINFPELTSIAVNASVLSIVINPPQSR